MKKTILTLFTVLVASGCEYVPRVEHKIETVDGSVITLLCPEINPDRSTVTYIIDGGCVIKAPPK